MVKSINLEMFGLGFIFYSPFAASQIKEGDDYFSTDFADPTRVEQQAVDGKIVGVSTGTPGLFSFEIYCGYPSNEMVENHQYRLRLGVEVRDGKLCLRGLYDLMDWFHDCPEDQTIELDNGYYHITLLSNPPPSGINGDNQRVLVYLEKLTEMPRLKYNGVPTLC